MTSGQRSGGLQATAWIDGACRGNPGDAGFGLVVVMGEETHEICGFLGRTTNNVAEYAGLIAALTFARQHGVTRLQIYSDSQLMVRQLQGTYRVKAAHLVPIFLKVLELKQSVPEVQVEHVPREENRDADRLANLSIDRRSPPPPWLQLEIPVQ